MRRLAINRLSGREERKDQVIADVARAPGYGTDVVHGARRPGVCGLPSDFRQLWINPYASATEHIRLFRIARNTMNDFRVPDYAALLPVPPVLVSGLQHER